MEFDGGAPSETLGLGFDPFTDSPSVLLDHVCDLAPGLFVASVLEMVDPAVLSPRDAVRYLQIHERVVSWWASRANIALVAAAGLTPTVEEFILLDRLSDCEREIRIRELPRDELAAALRWGPVATQTRIDQARLLTGPLAPTQEALALGEITPGQVRLLSDSVQRLSSWDALENAIIELERAEGAEGADSPESAHALTRAAALALSEAQATFDNVVCFNVRSFPLPAGRGIRLLNPKRTAISVSLTLPDRPAAGKQPGATAMCMSCRRVTGSPL
jgi:hypothetical protein